MKLPRATCDILGAAFSISSSVALGKAPFDLIDIAALLDVSVRTVWTNLHPLVEHGICSVGADDHGRLSAVLDPGSLSREAAESFRGQSPIDIAPRAENISLPELARRLENLAFGGAAPAKAPRGRPRRDLSEQHRKSREITSFWNDFIAKVAVDFGEDVTTAPLVRRSACSPFRFAGAAMLAFGPDMSGRLTGPLDLACSVLGTTRPEIWPTLDRLLAISTTTIRSRSDGGIDLSIAPAWTRPPHGAGAFPRTPYRMEI